MPSLLKKYFLKSIFLLIPFIFEGQTLKAQEFQPAIEFIKQFKNVQDQIPRESVYLHTDRDWYFFGERIWISAYSVAGPYLTSSKLSSVLYVELIAPSGKVVKRELFKMENGRGQGSLAFEDTDLETGTYQLRAYTKWGVNFGDSYTFTKPIQVFDEEGKIPTPERNNNFDIQFFPESGHLISEIPTTLAFKAIGEDGLGLSVSGKIYTNKEVAVTEFSSEHLGMGAIEFTPQSGQKYYAVINGEKFPLPEIQPEGVVLNVNQTDEFFTADLNLSNQAQKESYLLFIHVRGEVYHVASINEIEGAASAVIPKDKFPSGIAYLTVLNGEGKAVAERLAYIHNPVDEILVNPVLNQSNFEPRERVEMKLQVRKSTGNNISGTASISVFDDEIHPFQPHQDNIVSHLRFGTEIKGYIEQPGFYFSGHKNAQKYLDLLMLTQGWRAYPNQLDKLKNQIKDLNPPEKGLEISGTISTLISDAPLKDAVVLLSVGSNHDQAQIITTDENGKFNATDLDAQGEELVTVKANRKGGSNRLWIELDEQFAGLADNREKVTQLPTDKSENTSNNEHKVAEQLKERSKDAIANSNLLIDAQMSGDLGEITVSGEAESDGYKNNPSSISNLSGPGTYLNLDESKHLRNLPIEQLLNQLPGVQYNMLTNSIKIRNAFKSFRSGELSPLLIVDGVEWNLDVIRTLSTNNIQSIAVARSALDLAIYGSRGAGGAIIINMRDGAEVLSSGNERGKKTTYIQGYQSPTKFYSPKYGVTVPKNHNQLDNRITLHWEPKANFSEEGKSIEFWTNDVASNYRINIQGITNNGLPFSHTTTFRVSNNSTQKTRN